ncbi:MAG: hypothetical protein AB1411_03960 [Nitrospirota bacterium]
MRGWWPALSVWLAALVRARCPHGVWVEEEAEAGHEAAARSSS